MIGMIIGLGGNIERKHYENQAKSRCQ